MNVEGYLMGYDDSSDTLEHYGVKGMRWGVRRYEKKASKNRQKAANAKNSKQYAKHITKALNNTERARIRAFESYIKTSRHESKLRDKGRVSDAKEYNKLSNDYLKRYKKANNYINNTYKSHNAKKYTTSSKQTTYTLNKGRAAISIIGAASVGVLTGGFTTLGPGAAAIGGGLVGGIGNANNRRKGQKYKVYVNK